MNAEQIRNLNQIKIEIAGKGKGTVEILLDECAKTKSPELIEATAKLISSLV